MTDLIGGKPKKGRVGFRLPGLGSLNRSRIACRNAEASQLPFANASNHVLMAFSSAAWGC